MGLKDADNQGKGPATDDRRVEKSTSRSSEDKGWGGRDIQDDSGDKIRRITGK